MAGAGSPMFSPSMRPSPEEWGLVSVVRRRLDEGLVPSVGDLWLMPLNSLRLTAEEHGIPLGQAHRKADVVWVMARWFEVKAEERGTPGTPGRWK